MTEAIDFLFQGAMLVGLVLIILVGLTLITAVSITLRNIFKDGEIR